MTSATSGDDPAAPAQTSRTEAFAASVRSLRITNTSLRAEQRRAWLGIVLPIVGIALILLGWWGVSGTPYVYQQNAYLISGGVLGLALVFVGGAIYVRNAVTRVLRAWLARVVADQNAQTDRVVEALAALEAATREQTDAMRQSPLRAAGDTEPKKRQRPLRVDPEA